MKIGILEAEVLAPDVVERFGSYGDMFIRLLSPISKDLSFRCYAAEHGELPQSTSECDAYVVTGSRHNAYDEDPWIEALKAFIRQLDAEKRKCLGICFGHQVIAQALGGRVEKSEKGWGIGAGGFEIFEQPKWLPTGSATFNILLSHQDQVVQLPEQAERFAGNSFCPNAGYFVGDHIFCLQGHPEFGRDYIQHLMDKRQERIGSERLADATQSLTLPVSTALFRDWLAAFLLPQPQEGSSKLGNL